PESKATPTDGWALFSLRGGSPGAARAAPGDSPGTRTTVSRPRSKTPIRLACVTSHSNRASFRRCHVAARPPVLPEPQFEHQQLPKVVMIVPASAVVLVQQMPHKFRRHHLPIQE